MSVNEGARNALDTYITGIVKDAREQAWREGYYAGKRDYAVSITGGVSTSTPNPYATHENEGSR